MKITRVDFNGEEIRRASIASADLVALEITTDSGEEITISFENDSVKIIDGAQHIKKGNFDPDAWERYHRKPTFANLMRAV